MQPVSVVIITFNEEHNISRCLDSVKEVADEIVILDSYSSDNTVDIAQRKGALVYQQAFLGYGPQKNKALELCKYDLVLSLDADEALDNTLSESICRAKQGDETFAYSMNRCTNYCGKFIRHGTWYPDTKIRFFDRRRARWSDGMIHEKVEVAPGTEVKHLPGDILHYSFNSIEEHVSQNNKFSTISAETMFQSTFTYSCIETLFCP